jgi:hypothetical protein
VTRKPNAFYSLARELAEAYGNPASIGMFMRDLSWLKKEGVDVDLAIEAWRQIRTPEGINGFSVPAATLRTVVTKGSPAYLVQFKDSIMSNMPAVYDSHSHDAYVLKNARLLKKLGFKYNGWSRPEDSEEGGSRLRYSVVEQLGLLPE